MMEDFYKLNPLVSCPEDVVREVNVNVSGSELNLGLVANNFLHLQHPQTSDRFVKNQIATHPLYPNLLAAYIQCRKVGAPQELASILEEISCESYSTDSLGKIGDNPELDEFMKSYCEVLHRYKQELSKPFNEATLFLCNIESQLSNLCNGTLTTPLDNNRSAEATGTSEDELNWDKVEVVEGYESSTSRLGDQELKQMLLRKYGGYLNSLRKEFLKKRKKGKLPKDARMMLMDWWNTHYRWPYPTEEEKVQLSEMTGLDQKQINNWFINQRKRHWKPAEDMRFTIMEGVNGSSIGGTM